MKGKVTIMLLQEVFNQYSQYQVVLTFSNNNDVLITDDCFNTQSKFYRRSKVRLGVDFDYVGYVHNNIFVRIQDINNAPSDSALVFRTYRGKNMADYMLYVFMGEFKTLEHYKKQVSYKRVMAQTCKQMTLNSITQPVPDKVLDICPHIYKNKTYFVSYRNNGLKAGIYHSPLYANTLPKDFYGYYLAVLVGLTVAKNYAGRITQVRVFHPDDNMTQGIYMFPLKKWRARNPYMIDYMNKIETLKSELQALGISICWMK